MTHDRISAQEIDASLLEHAAQTIHEALGGNGWAYSNYGGDEWNSKREDLFSAAKEVIALVRASAAGAAASFCSRCGGKDPQCYICGSAPTEPTREALELARSAFHDQGIADRVPITLGRIERALAALAHPAPAAKAETACRENLREAWSALAMIREAVETFAPSGSVKASEHLDGPTFMDEADALVAGIQAIAAPAAQQNEPVAWIANDPDGGPYLTYSSQAAHNYPNPQPLYAAPPALSSPPGMREALELLLAAALLMPRSTPKAGGAGTVHDFKIEAAYVWALDEACKAAQRTLFTPPSLEPAASALRGERSPAGSSPELEAILKDPAAVHLNMLRGGIAMPSLENIKHLYPEVRDAFAAVEELKTALKPFVDAFDWVEAKGLPYHNIAVGEMGDRLSYQDFERAKAALPSTSKTCGGDRHG